MFGLAHRSWGPPDVTLSAVFIGSSPMIASAAHCSAVEGRGADGGVAQPDKTHASTKVNALEISFKTSPPSAAHPMGQRAKYLPVLLAVVQRCHAQTCTYKPAEPDVELHDVRQELADPHGSKARSGHCQSHLESLLSHACPMLSITPSEEIQPAVDAVLAVAPSCLPALGAIDGYLGIIRGQGQPPMVMNRSGYLVHRSMEILA